MSATVDTPFTRAVRELDSCLSEMVAAIYEGTDTDRKIALTHLLDARHVLGDEAGKLADT